MSRGPTDSRNEEPEAPGERDPAQQRARAETFDAAGKRGDEPERDSVGRRVARHSGWLLSAQLATAAFSLVQAILLTRVLGLEQYGLFVIVTTIVASVAQLFDSRLFETLTRFVPHFRARGEEAKARATLRLRVGVEVLAGLIAFGLVTWGAELAARTFAKDLAATGAIRLYAFAALVGIAQEPCAAVLRIADRFTWLARYQVASAAVTTAALAVAASAGSGLHGMLAALLVGTGLASVAVAALAAVAWRRLGLSAGPASLGDSRREVLHFALHSNLNATSRLVSGRADLLVLGLFATPAAVATYDLAKRLVQQGQALSVPLYTALFPEMARLVAEGDHDAVRRLRAQLTRAVLVAVVPACAAGGLLAPLVLGPVFGAEFARSAPILQLLIWQLLWLPLVWFPGFLLSVGRARELAATSAADALFYALLLFALVPVWGAVGAAVAALGRTAAWVGLAITTVRRVDRAGWEAEAG